MKVTAVLGKIMVFVCLLCAQTISAAGQSTVPPAAPQGRAPQATPPPGTQDDRQIPDSRNTRNAPSQSGDTPTASADQSARTKSSFGQKVALKSLAGMQLGQLAQSNTTNGDIRDLGKMMVDDHSRMYSEIKSLLQNNGLNVTTALDAGHQADYDKLSKLSGDAFDREFVAQAVTELKEAVSDYQSESASADDTWRGFTTDNLRTIQQELEKAEMLMQSHTNRQATPIRTRRNQPAWARRGQTGIEEEA